MSDWNRQTLEDCCEIYDGPHATPIKRDSGPYFLSISSLQEGRLDLSESAFLSEEDYQTWTKRVTPRHRDIVFSYETRLGQAAMIPEGLRCCLGRRMGLLRSKDPDIADPSFLLHYYLGAPFQSVIRNNTVFGTTVDRIPLQKMGEFEILLPPLSEQKKIAEILSWIDKVIDNLKSCLGKQEILKKSLLSKLIFNANANANLGRSSETSHYCLGDISTRITDGTHQAVKTSKHGTIPFLYVSCIKDGLIDWGKSALISEEQYAIATQGRQPSPGDILYTVVGSYGNAVMVATNHRFCFQRHIALIQLDKQKAVPKFIELALSSDQTKKLVDQVVAGNAQPTLTLGELRKLQIPLPSPDTQQRICEIIAPVEQNISNLANKINAMHYLKQSVASDLLSGRKRVTI